MSIVDPVVRDDAAQDERSQRDENLSHSQPQADDNELLRRFVTDRDEVAFTQIVTRHSPLVMGVCRRTLGNEQDAEDAFQATFLVLARKAASVRRGASLPAWLHKTAHRIALRARVGRFRRREQPLEAETMIASDTFSHIATEHQRSVFDEELNRLPEKYRLPIFLCCVEGKSRDAAAEQLRLSPGALKGRLERGRQILRRKLMLRGVSVSVALAVLLYSQQIAQAAHTVAPALISSTAHAGVQYAAGKSTSGLVSQHAISLANGSFQIMQLATTKLVVCCLLAIGTLALVGSWLPAPVQAGGDAGDTIVLTDQSDKADSSDTIVAFHFDGKREGERGSAEAESPRRSPEGQSDRRRSPEAETGRRRSPEGEAGARRSAEREGNRDGNNPLQGFRPQTQREAALYQMILQLQRDVADLRRDLQRQQGAAVREGERGPRDGESANQGPRDGDVPALAGWEKTKAGGVFRVYDKNGDQFVELAEWLAMTNGNINAARRQLQTQRFLEIGPGADKKLSAAEFISWWNSREGIQRDRDGAQRGPRDGEGRRSAEGEAVLRRSAEGEGQRRSPESEAAPRRSSERDR